MAQISKAILVNRSNLSTAIYFLLRRDVDATEMDEVFLDQDESEEAYGLPPLKTDDAGAPTVDDEVPEIEPDDADSDDADSDDADRDDADSDWADREGDHPERDEE